MQKEEKKCINNILFIKRMIFLNRNKINVVVKFNIDENSKDKNEIIKLFNQKLLKLILKIENHNTNDYQC